MLYAEKIEARFPFSCMVVAFILPTYLQMAASVPSFPPAEIPSPFLSTHDYNAYCQTTCLALLDSVTRLPSDSPERIAAITTVFSFMNGAAKQFLLGSGRRFQLAILSKCWEFKAIAPTPSHNMLGEIAELFSLIGHVLRIPRGYCGECTSCCTGMAATCMALIDCTRSPFISCEIHHETPIDWSIL